MNCLLAFIVLYSSLMCTHKFLCNMSKLRCTWLYKRDSTWIKFCYYWNVYNPLVYKFYLVNKNEFISSIMVYFYASHVFILKLFRDYVRVISGNFQPNHTFVYFWRSSKYVFKMLATLWKVYTQQTTTDNTW